MKHYHCLSEMYGYLPNENYPCKTKVEAQQIACDIAKERREEGLRVVGNKKGGWYEIGNSEYIEVVPCFEEDCLDEQ